MDVDFQACLAAGLEKIGLDVSEPGCKRLELYFVELKKWAKKVNLIAKNSSDEQIIENHFLDSLMIVPFLRGANPHLLDVGTGAGFPGLVCKAVIPDLKLTLVEPRLKRVSFLNHVIRTLGLMDVASLACRIEDDGLLLSDGSFSHITCRAVADIDTFLKMVKRFSPTGATLICMKGPKWKEEIDCATEILQQSYKLLQVETQSLPFSNAERNLLLFQYR